MKLDIIIPVGPGHEKLVNEAVQSVKIACRMSTGPFKDVKVKAVDDTKGQMGRSAARNYAIKASKAEVLFFLDADDVLHPNAFNHYTPFIGYDAVWGNIAELRDGCIVPRFQMPRIENFDDLLDIDPYYTLQIGFFVRRDVMPLFNEDMNTGEDWEVYLNLWKKHQCLKQEQIFMVNRRGQHSEGPKSANGREWMEAVYQQIEGEKRARDIRQKLTA